MFFLIKKVEEGRDMNEHKFPYEWTLKDAAFTKDKGKVFSCFACLLAYYPFLLSFVKNNTQMCNYFMKIFVFNTQLSYICRVIQN